MNKFVFKFLILFLVSKKNESDGVFTPVFAC